MQHAQLTLHMDSGHARVDLPDSPAVAAQSWHAGLLLQPVVSAWCHWLQFGVAGTTAGLHLHTVHHRSANHHYLGCDCFTGVWGETTNVCHLQHGQLPRHC